MGKTNRCMVELATKVLSSEQVQKVEEICNELIREGVAMTPRWITPESPDMQTVCCVSLSAQREIWSNKICLYEKQYINIYHSKPCIAHPSTNGLASNCL